MKLSEDVYGVILDTFIPSKTMRAYLKTVELDERQILQLICGAPVSLYLKYDFLVILSDCHPCFMDALCDTEKALNALRLAEGELFYLKEKWYDSDDLIEKESGNAPCLSVDKAIELIKDDFGDEVTEQDFREYTANCCWAQLEKWSPGRDGFEHTYTYYMIEDELCFFDDERTKSQLTAGYSFFTEGRHLNLPVSFRVGDIVSIDCTPFMPKKEAVLLEVGDNTDCCCLQALYETNEYAYSYGAVKHGSLFFDSYPSVLLSPLYRLEKCQSDNAVLNAVSHYLGGDEQRGAALWYALYQDDKVVSADTVRRHIGQA